MSEQIQVTLEEFYQIIGELEVVRRKQTLQLQSLYNQIREMSAEIEELRKELSNGGLVETNNN